MGACVRQSSRLVPASFALIPNLIKHHIIEESIGLIDYLFYHGLSFYAPMVEFTANAVAATPETIWRTCIESMKWESWDRDLREVCDVSGTGLCMEGTTCTFCMKDGQDLAIKLTNVIINESVDFNGSFMNGLLRAEGKVRIMPNANADSSLSSTSQIKYSFELLGVVGMLAMMFKKNEVVDGTRVGLDNMVRMSEEAQRGK